MRSAVGLAQTIETQPRNADQGLLLERPIRDDLKASKKGSWEMAGERAGEIVGDRVGVRTLGAGRDTLNMLVRRIGGEHDERVGEVRLNALCILHPATVKHLVEHLHNIAVSLLDLIEQDDAVRRAADPFGEDSTFTKTDVARGGALEAGNSMRFLVLAHVDGEEPTPEKSIGKSVRSLSLAHTGRANEKKSPNRPASIGKTGEIGPSLRGDACQSVVLTDDPSTERILKSHGSAARVSDHGADRNAGEIRYNARDVVLLERLRPISIPTANASSGAGRVKDRDGLVRKTPADDVTLGKGHGALDRSGINGDPVMLGKPFRNAIEHGKGLVRIWLVDPHWSHAPGKPRIRLDMTAPLLPTARAQDAHATTREDGTKGISTTGGLISEEKMEIIEKENDVQTLRFGSDRLETLLDRAPDNSTGTKCGEVYGPYNGGMQIARCRITRLGHGRNESHRAGRLADTGFANNDRTALGATKKNRGSGTDGGLQTNHRIELTGASSSTEVTSESRELAKILRGGCGVLRSRRGSRRSPKLGRIDPIKARELGNERGPKLAPAHQGLEKPEGTDLALRILFESERPSLPKQSREGLVESGQRSKEAFGLGRDTARKESLYTSSLATGTFESAHRVLANGTVPQRAKKKTLDGDGAGIVPCGIVGNARKDPPGIDIQVLIEPA